MKKIASILILSIATLLISFEKPVGQGGDSTITGKVHVTNYNSTFTVVNSTYYGGDVDVFIVYGNDATYGDKTSTGPDGVFEFKYLRTGNYKIFVYSKDKAAYLAGNINAPETAVFKSGEITDKKQTVDFGTLEIFK